MKPKSSILQRNKLNSRKQNSKEDESKKQSKISSYFQKSTSKSDTLFTSVGNGIGTSNSLAPNFQKYLQNKKTFVKDVKAGKPAAFSDHNPYDSPENDSDIEIIESTPEVARTRSFILTKQSSKEVTDSPDVIPPTPTAGADKTLCNISNRSNVSLKPMLNISSKMKSKSLLSKRSLVNKSELCDSDNITKPLKRMAETGCGFSPNSKKNMDSKNDVNSEVCKSNITTKFDSSSSLFEQSCHESSFSVLNCNTFEDPVNDIANDLGGVDQTDKIQLPMSLSNINTNHLESKSRECLNIKEYDERELSTSCVKTSVNIHDSTEISSLAKTKENCIDVVNVSSEKTETLSETHKSPDWFMKRESEIKSNLLLTNSVNGHLIHENGLSAKVDLDIPESMATSQTTETVQSNVTTNTGNSSGFIEEPSEDSIDDLLNIDFESFSPFKKERKISEDASIKVDKLVSEGIGNLSFAVKKNFGRHVVVAVERNIYQRETCLYMKALHNGQKKQCFLTGFWFESVVKEGDVIHILFAEEHEDVFRISNEKGLIVINPDYLLSGTSVVSGVFCTRKAVLNERFKGFQSNNKIMVIGSLVHQLFQQVVQNKNISEQFIASSVSSFVKQPQFLKELYGMNLAESDIQAEIMKFSSIIHSWTESYLDGLHKSKNGCKVKGNNWRGKIDSIVDIEENIWSPRFGIKGKIDLTVETRNEKGRKVVPLELKTGKSSFSAEHKGQLILYTMMMADRRKDPESGLLLYLRDGSMAEIPAGDKEKKGLIQLRNQLVQFVSFKVSGKSNDSSVCLPPLPETLDNKRLCSGCSQLLPCSLMQKLHGNVPEEPHAMASLVPSTIGHLSEAHLEYFRKWCLMLHLEISSSSNEAQLRALWCHDPQTRESNGSCLSYMEMNASVDEIGSGQFLHKLVRSGSVPTHLTSAGSGTLPQCFQIGDSVVLSSEDEIALSTGVVYFSGSSSVSVVLDRNLSVYRSGRVRLLHVDRLEFQSTMSLMFTNLSQLMENNQRSETLRRLIIDKEKPEFEGGLSRDLVAKIKSILKVLNKEQQRAVLRSLLAKHYSVLKGFPGTGKTLTIVGLVRLLSATGHSVLLTSYTHSAVDNILLKLKEYDDISFVRLGRASRVHKDVLDRCDDVIAKTKTSLEELSKFYDEANVVATTCLGMGHPIFRRKVFDFCIVDEASQALEAACLGPLFFCSRFVLVGDPLQLPPVVKSQSAKTLGMMESLMERLEGTTEASVCLTLQYRMNEPIMNLANHLTYAGRLQCAHEHLKKATLRLRTPDRDLSELPVWMQKCCSDAVEDSVVWVDTRDCSEAGRVDVQNRKDARPDGKSGQTVNFFEARLVLDLIKNYQEMGVGVADIGVITPFRDQVKLLRERSKVILDGSSLALEVNTVDQYQGRDKEVILYSCVKSQLSPEDVKDGEILNDLRRLNVAVTRAKRKLVIFGDSKSLALYKPFKMLFEVLAPSQMVPAEDIELEAL